MILLTFVPFSPILTNKKAVQAKPISIFTKCTEKASSAVTEELYIGNEQQFIDFYLLFHSFISYSIHSFICCLKDLWIHQLGKLTLYMTWGPVVRESEF